MLLCDSSRSSLIGLLYPTIAASSVDPVQAFALVIESPSETEGTGAGRGGMLPFASGNAELTLDLNCTALRCY